MESAEEQEKLGDWVPHDDPKTVPVEVYKYVLKPDGTPSGYIRRVGNRQLMYILNDLIAKLGEDYKELDYFGYSSAIERKDRGQVTWPEKWHWIACYVVTGGSEGYYIHVDVIFSDGTREMIFLGKSLSGMDLALRVANKCTKFLGA